MRFLDANIILRYLTRDDEAKAQRCLSLFQRLSRGEEQVTTCEVILHEVLYVLTSKRHYGLSHEEAASRLRPVLSLRGLKIPQKRLYLRALDLYSSSQALDFGDAVAVGHVEDQGIEEVYSYDGHFDPIESVQRVEP